MKIKTTVSNTVRGNLAEYGCNDELIIKIRISN